MVAGTPVSRRRQVEKEGVTHARARGPRMVQASPRRWTDIPGVRACCARTATHARARGPHMVQAPPPDMPGLCAYTASGAESETHVRARPTNMFGRPNVRPERSANMPPIAPQVWEAEEIDQPDELVLEPWVTPNMER